MSEDMKGVVVMKAVRVNELWQLAGVHYVRTETMVKGFRNRSDCSLQDPFSRWRRSG